MQERNIVLHVREHQQRHQHREPTPAVSLVYCIQATGLPALDMSAAGLTLQAEPVFKLRGLYHARVTSQIVSADALQS